MQVQDIDRYKCNIYNTTYNGMQWWFYNQEKLYLSFELVLNTQLPNYSTEGMKTFYIYLRTVDKYLALRLVLLKDI